MPINNDHDHDDVDMEDQALSPEMEKLIEKLAPALVGDSNVDLVIREMKPPGLTPTFATLISSLKDIVKNQIQLSCFFIVEKEKKFFFMDTIKPNESVKLFKKCILFLNKSEAPLTLETIPHLIYYEVGTANPLKYIHELTTEVFVPILQNSDNQRDWTDLLSKDLMEKLNSFNATMYLTLGQVEGKTKLPLPPKKIIESSEISSKDKADIFNNSIITWMKQIRKVLDLEPEQSLKNGNDPGPMEEIMFWRKKADNLNSIYQQLKSHQVEDILRTLRESKSTYASEFEKQRNSIKKARDEANDNYMYLRTLETYFVKLGNQDFKELPELFMPIMKVILLIWERSTYYNKASRLVVLIREICNAIIKKALEFVPGANVRDSITNSSTVETACKDLQTTIDVCAKFKESFFRFKNQSKNSTNGQGWGLPMNALFIRLDSFLERCHDILHITDTIVQFNKLAKVKIGGTKGKNLSTTVSQIFTEFAQAVNTFMSGSEEGEEGEGAGDVSDIMDISNKAFDDSFFEFRNTIKELERRLAAVITQSFDDTDTLIDKFRLLDSFEDLLKRPIIQDELEKKHIVLIETYKRDLKAVQEVFVNYSKTTADKVDERVIYKNLPPVAGTLNWTKSLRGRISSPLEKLALISPDIADKEEFKDVTNMKNAIEKKLSGHEQKILMSWKGSEGERALTFLENTLLVRDESNGTLRVNFDLQLVSLLREVKYLKMLDDIEIPLEAEKVYSKGDTLRKQVNKLEQIVDKYNFVVTKLEVVEEPLITSKIEKMNENLKPGIDDIKWKSPDVDSFIHSVSRQITEVYEIVESMKNDLEKIRNTLDNLNSENKQVLDRKGKPVAPEDFLNEHQGFHKQQTDKIKKEGSSIVKKIKDITDKIIGGNTQSAAAFKKMKEYKDYQEFINDIVIDGLSKAICTSLSSLNQLIEIREQKRLDPNYQPMFGVQLDVRGDDIQFDPEIGSHTDQKSIRSILERVVSDYVSYACCIQRIDTNAGDYMNEMHDNFEIRDNLARINENVNKIVDRAEAKKLQYAPYKILWSTNPQESFNEFLAVKDSRNKAKNTDADDPTAANEDPDQNNPIMEGITTKIPPFATFQEKIQELKKLKKEVLQLNPIEDIEWLRIDSNPLKNSLENKADFWIDMYTNFFLTQVKRFLENCENFKKELEAGIKKDPSDHPEDTNLLKKVMSILGKERIVISRLPYNVDFVKKMIKALKENDVEIKVASTNKQSEGKGEDFNTIVDNIDATLREISNTKIYAIKTSILPLKQKETAELKASIQKFSDEISNFRAEFLKKAPFDYNKYISIKEMEESYDKLDRYYAQLQEFRRRAEEFKALEQLFELEESKYKQIKDCQIDIEKLKVMWDLICVIKYTYDSWMRVPWKKINYTEYYEENQRFIEQLKKSPKEVKIFKGFKPLEEEVNNMKKIISSVSSLMQTGLTKRHWQELSEIVNSTIEENSPSFCFETLVKVNIHQHETKVLELCEQAEKQSKISKTLGDISKNWKERVFEFDSFMVTGEEVKIIKQFDEVQNELSADNLKVLGLLSQGKSVEIFSAILKELKEKLGYIDDCIVLWEKVQKNWKRLVNIFMLSEDIRNQLPVATKIFEDQNNEFRAIMSDAYMTQVMYEICTPEKKESLKMILTNIEKSEKQLNQYLEQKKKIFPRFYFVSNQTLIDILSNGNNPVKIATEYLGDLFDGLKKLRVAKTREGDNSLKAEAMESKDTEIVEFQTPFEPAPGEAVELWLKNLEMKMRESLEEYLIQAKKHADGYMRNPEKKQSQMDWITGYCAQIALLVTQIVWTEDVHQAFDDIEGGMSNAMKDCLTGIKDRIGVLIEKVRGQLTPDERNKIITIITVDVHSRDAVEKLFNLSINDKENFQWGSQLKFFLNNYNDIQDILQKGQKVRFKWEERRDRDKAVIRIVDWARFYTYEYVGNCGRLVITPLTDRCYITLTQALGLCMGGAPAGPAGTGKTETTKDLGRGVGLAVFVFNCSEQMSTDSLGQQFMGLSQTGAWGCFDEFNRISIEVLSVVSTQVKSIQDSLRVFLRTKEDKFNFGEEEITLEDTVGLFITMNPGYAGRTELPESLKALFRSCAMVVPDLVLICENMLMSEGYTDAKELAKKFVTIYMLSRSLLSKQKHYDWGLRAVKSVLRQAGKLKRDKKNSELSENQLLMRALRDFNLPKIYSEDKPIFLNLIKDLFKRVKVDSVTNETLDDVVVKVARRNSLIAEAGGPFSLKCIQLSEILEVRHCVFVIGPPGSGKSTVWKTLAETFKEMGEPAERDCLDPKSVTADELFGVLTKSKEFKNGVLSSIIRNQSKEDGKYKATHKHKWAVLDGDIDPNWIESLNTVMDDNKVLTLVSNDRFPLSASMRLIFEISNLRNATLATVSRAGVLYINESDIGWNPYFESWLNSHKIEVDEKGKKIAKDPRTRIADFDDKAVSVFYGCFNQYLSKDKSDMMKYNRISPMVEIAMIETTCAIIDELVFENIQIINKFDNDAAKKQAYEGIFFFAAMWGFGGPMLNDPADEKRSYHDFNNSWKAKAKIPDIKMEENDAISRPIYDFEWDIQELAWKLWDVPEFELKDDNFLRIFVPNVNTVRMSHLLNLHVNKKKPIILVGSAGTGKTAIVNQYLNSLQRNDSILTYNTNFSSKTSSESLQENIMNSGIGKLGTRYYGLSGKTLVFFIDDFNMPYVDKYGTQSPIALLRQIIDYSLVYDRENLEEYITLQDLYFCACLNPKAGSFTIEQRLQRHFSLFACQTPDEMSIKQIYKQILSSHFTRFKFTGVDDMAKKLTNSSFNLFNRILQNGKVFSPTAQKFHYQFNLRDLSRVTEGIMLATQMNYNDKPFDVFKLWVHECRRVFEDRLISAEDIAAFKQLLERAFDENLVAETPFIKPEHKDAAMSDNNVFTTFVGEWSAGDKSYMPIESMTQLRKCLAEKLAEYNSTNTQMNLVLFDEAIFHICKIARIIDRPAGNALLIGVGGSGKQSLTKLAAHLHKHELRPIKVSANFDVKEFKDSFVNDFVKVTKQSGDTRTLLATDAQLSNEVVLIYLNEILNSGYISGIMPKLDLDAHLQTMKNEAKQTGFTDSLYLFFVEKIKKNLHVCLCMSPVGDTLRIRARRFPGIVNQSQIDWFHSWPQNALYDVAYSFLKDMPLPPKVEELDFDIRKALAENMAETHISINEVNKEFLLKERRHNYTTPKSFLELIDFYKSSYKVNNEKIATQIASLQKSLVVLVKTSEKVADLKKKLVIISRDVEEKSKIAEDILVRVNKDKAIAEEEEAKAKIEEEKTNEAKKAAETAAANAEKEFKNAKPMLEKAIESLDNLSEKDIGEMKTFPKPHPMIILVGKALLYLLEKKKGIDLYNDKNAEKEWPDIQKMMKEAKKFKTELESFAAGPAKVLEAKKKDYMRRLLSDPEFQYKPLRGKSVAAAGLCDFLHNIIAFSDAFQIVAPLEEISNAAIASKEASIKKLEAVIEKVNESKEKVRKLEAELNESMEKKRLVEEDRNYNMQKMQNAEDLVTGLSTNQIRWSQNEQKLQSETLTNVGDSLLAAEFVSYIGPFSAYFRRKLWEDIWIPKITEKKIPITEGIDPMSILTNAGMIANWKNEGLPEDQMSCENAAIITSSNRWPLIIDPQLQGGNWIAGHVANPENFKRTIVEEKKGGEEEEAEEADVADQLLRISLNSDKWEVKLEEAITSGRIVMLENVTQDIDPMLDPLLSRAFSFKKGGSRPYIMLTREEPIPYHPDFRLFLQCKRSSPHFKPETAAQCSIINFIVTEKGLEDQLLAVVVDVERPELERKKVEVMKSMNDNAVQLAKLDNQLLYDLSKANPETILEDKELINTLNKTKTTSKNIEKETEESKITEKQINEQRNSYREVAAEGAMLYFLIISLNAVQHVYQYSLEGFQAFFDKGIQRTPKEEKGTDRIKRMVLVIRETIYQWISRGLFERHKIIFLTMITFRLMNKRLLNVESTDKEMKYLLNCVPKTGVENPIKDWLKGAAWGNVLRLADINGFEKLPESMGNELASRFKEWYSEQNPEQANLPPSWKFVNQQPFKKLLVLRALRPDRMIPALSNFIKDALPEGEKFVNMDQSLSFAGILKSAFDDAKQESSMNTPIFFILSPGSDPVSEVEALGQKEGFTSQKNNYFNISLGQGQDIIANSRLDMAYREGCWVMLQNIHLMPSWLGTFEKILDRFYKEGGASDRFRLFLSADSVDYIPIGIIEKCIKLTNEPPAGLKANIKRAWNYFSPQEIDEKDTKVKAVLFGLCYFHSVLIERRKFGPKGWNMFYPFNIGDLRDSAKVLENSIDPGSGRLPWADFKYIFGEIMYGGHIVDDWDRRLCSAYLENLMMNDLLSEEFQLIPYAGDKASLKTPAPNVSHDKFNERIEISLGDVESPLYYGLHPNAEINLGTVQCNNLFDTLVMLQPNDTTASSSDDPMSAEKMYETSYIVKVQQDWVLKERMFVLEDIKDRCGEARTPYQNVFLQECEYMNILLEEICSSLGQLKKAKDGELTFNEKLETLENCLNLEKIPEYWVEISYPAKRSLATWFDNLLKRIEQLSTWKDDPSQIPRITRINLLFNPQSFLTAIKQESKTGEDLNKLMISTEFTKKTFEQIDTHAKDGAAYCYGFLLDGASWDVSAGCMDEARPKEMFSHMPVCLCRATKAPDIVKETPGTYICPVYRTEMRGNTYICEAQLKTPAKYEPRKWILAGVAIILDVEGESDEIKIEKDKK